MKPTEAAALLTIAAAYDNRKPDPDAAQAWAIALDGYRFEDCRDVIVAHYRKTADWLMPTHVITEVKRVRAKRIAEAGDPTPPPDLTPRQTIDWLKEARRRIADGESIDDTAAYGELTEHRLPELRAFIQRGPGVDQPAPLLAPEDHSREPVPATKETE